LVAAITPPLGRTVMAAAVHETVDYADASWPLFSARWASGAIDPHGYRLIEHFHLDGTTPLWTYACADALIEKRVWMEPGANTTYVRWRVRRPREPPTLALKGAGSRRGHHAPPQRGDWRMDVARVPGGLRVVAFDGAQPLLLQAPGADVETAHDWYRGFELVVERERGLDHVEDHLHVGRFRAVLPTGAS